MARCLLRAATHKGVIFFTVARCLLFLLTVARCLLRATTHKGVNESHCATPALHPSHRPREQFLLILFCYTGLCYNRFRIVLNLPLQVILERQIRLI